jgi:hypothetical protein
VPELEKISPDPSAWRRFHTVSDTEIARRQAYRRRLEALAPTTVTIPHPYNHYEVKAFTLGQVAEWTGRSEATARRWANGKALPPAMLRLCQALAYGCISVLCSSAAAKKLWDGFYLDLKTGELWEPSNRMAYHPNQLADRRFLEKRYFEGLQYWKARDERLALEAEVIRLRDLVANAT